MILRGLVSVVIPVFNRESMLVEAVSCVDAQTYRPIEIILVDDGSTDGTGALCDRLARERPEDVKGIHQQNGGPGAAREAGRQAARGEYVQYLDSDDWLAPEKFETQVTALEAQVDAGACYCPTRERFADGTYLGRPSMRTGESVDAIFPAFLTGRLWQTVTPLWRRTSTDRIGAWTSLRVEEDLEYDARAGALGVRPTWCPGMLAEHRHHAGPRASGQAARDTSKMADRARSHELVYRHAVNAGVGPGDPAMQQYARELFLLARQCGAVGLADQSRRLFELAREAAGPERGRGIDFIAYSAVAAASGWQAAGWASCAADRLRRKGRR